MRKILAIIFVVFTLSFQIKNAQAQLTVDWYSPSLEINGGASKMMRDNADNLFVLSQLSLTKFNSSGSQLWSISKTNASIDDVVIDNNGNSYVTFTTSSWEVYTIKYDVYGTSQWEKVLSDFQGIYGGSKIGIDVSGNIIVTCNWNHLNVSYLYVVKYNPNGDFQWNYASTAYTVYDLTIDQYGNIYLTNRSSQNSPFYLLKLDGGGIFQYGSLIGDGVYGLAYDQGSASLFIHRGEAPATYFFEKIDPNNGNMIWFDSVTTNVGWGTACSLDGLGNVYFPIGGGYGGIVRKYSTAGIFQFEFPYDNGFDTDGSGNIYAVQTYGSQVKKYSSAGNLLWTYSDPSHYTATPILVNPDNKLYAIASDNYSIGLIKYSPCSVPVISISANGPIIFCNGAKVKFTATASSGSTYQWQKDGEDVSGATKKTYNAKDQGAYSCRVSNSCGPNTSNSITVTVLALPASKIKTVSPVNICAGQTATLNAKTCSGCTYQWQKNNMNISNATNSYYGATQAGYYTVTTTNTSNCSKTSKSCVVNITCKEEEEVITAFHVYPSPANHMITIELDGITSQRSIELFDLIGKRVYNTIAPADGITQVDVGSLPAGAYLLRVSTNDWTQTRKIDIVR
ncbi:MAG: T9SS type A sorting domain-containing protein [Chitinophagaceae bacterium]|nr:T9SS type A sorting domain-containing protein [Chitinophagaceae bacterium]